MLNLADIDQDPQFNMLKQDSTNIKLDLECLRFNKFIMFLLQELLRSIKKFLCKCIMLDQLNILVGALNTLAEVLQFNRLLLSELKLINIMNSLFLNFNLIFLN